MIGRNRCIPYPLDGGNRYIGSVLLNEPLSNSSGKTQYLRFLSNNRQISIGCQMGGSPECVFGAICDNKSKWYLIALIYGLCSAIMAVVINLVIILEDRLDI